MKNRSTAAQFAIGCVIALVAGALFLVKDGGFDDDVSTGKQIAITVGITLFGAVITVLRSRMRSAAWNAGRKARASREARRGA